MKQLNNILEGILDTDLDVNIISFEEFINAVIKKKTAKQIKDFVSAISTSFEPADGDKAAHDYFGVIEVQDHIINIYYDPFNTTSIASRVTGALRRVIEINLKTGKRKVSSTGCHWLIEPCYSIPWSKENLNWLNKLYMLNLYARSF